MCEIELSNMGKNSGNLDLVCEKCDFKQCGSVTSVDSDESVQPPSRLRNSKGCSVSSLTLIIFKRLAKALIRLRVCAC